MAFYREDYVLVKKKFEEKRNKAKEQALARREYLCEQIPGMRQICDTIESAGPRAYRAALLGREGFDERFAEIRRQTEVLVEKQAEILAKNGFPKDYFDVKYECPVCRDEGNVDGRMCECMRAELIKTGYVSSGISGLCGRMSFETFDTSYYSGEDRRNAELILDRCRRYAKEFHGKGSGSMIFMGGTGLGKTHMSVAVAKAVVEAGYSVYYRTAEELFADFRAERFRRFDDSSPVRTDRYAECELLVIDDLGTETSGRDVTSFLYSLLNMRINSGMPTLISTNLSHKDMISVYDERIASRLLGEFLPYRFTGTDVRMQKLKE